MSVMRVVVVGGGFGGVKTALELANKPGIEITLISSNDSFEYHGALYRTATGRSPEEVVIPLRHIFAKSKNVRIVRDTIVAINPKKNQLTGVSGKSFTYDQVVLALGSQLNYFGIEGMAEHSASLDTVHNTINLRQTLADLMGGQKDHVTIAVVGAGPAGLELAAELPRFAELVSDKYDGSPERLEIVLIEAADRVLPTLKPELSAKVLGRLHYLGVDVRLSTMVKAAKPQKLILSNGELNADLVVWTAGSKLPGFFAEHPDVFSISKGRVDVDEFQRALGHANIFIAGDNALTPFSGMAQTALHDAISVARNLERIQAGKSLEVYEPSQPVYIVPVGPKWAAFQTGDKVITGYRGWIARRRADLQIFRNFEPYRQAVNTWRQAHKLVKF